MESFTVVDVVIDRERGHLEMTFDDGFIGCLDLETVRRACPCAACRGRRDNGLEAWVASTNGPPLQVRDAELAGAWGLSLRWSDGHDTGIYPWASLRRWAQQP